MLKTDVLIVGGSLSGMCAAITAKETNPELEVTVVEKYTTGYAGKANRGAGIMDAMAGVDPEKYVEYHPEQRRLLKRPGISSRLCQGPG